MPASKAKADKAERAPKARPEKPRAKAGSGKPLRLGLAARVVLIGCIAAVIATVAQWVVTPLLLRPGFDRARLQYAASAAEQLATIAQNPLKLGNHNRLQNLTEMMAEPLPGGDALVVSDAGHVIAASNGAAGLAQAFGDQLPAQTGAAVTKRGEILIGAYPIIVDGQRFGSALVAYQPKPLISTWIAVLAGNALVLVLALGVLAPFMLPLARKALSPVTRLEARIRARTAQDKSKLAATSDDTLLKPLLGAIDEVHERSETAMRRALRMAFADPVTRLPNRLRFMSKLEGSVDRGQKGGAPAAPVLLALCDLNQFRKINVNFGPRVADEVLAQVAERLRASAAEVAPGAYFIGRIGADQFGVIAPGDDGERLRQFLGMAERLIHEPMMVEHQSIRVTASFGVAHAPQDAQTAAELLKLAELALKEAKKAPAMRRAFFDSRMLHTAKEQSRLEQELREGLERREFVAVFQPKVKLESGELVGAEALARWRRPDGTVVSPGRFVPIAEEMGLIGKLGNCVMRDACFAAAEWNKRGVTQRIAVNISPHQFNDPDFISQVYQALDDSGLDPRLLELEITESAAVSEPERVARVMWPLRNRGVRLAIDDFGTGHSNFASITRLPFDVFKIDQQFIRALSNDPHAPAIVEMILAMAEALGQETVAEGVETREQADFLLRRNCTIGQGYYFSPPLPAHEFDVFVRSWRPRPANRFAA